MIMLAYLMLDLRFNVCDLTDKEFMSWGEEFWDLKSTSIKNLLFFRFNASCCMGLKNSVAWVRERPPFAGEISANFCW
jgi:hypothetical protein